MNTNNELTEIKSEIMSLLNKRRKSTFPSDVTIDFLVNSSRTELDKKHTIQAIEELLKEELILEIDNCLIINIKKK